MLNSKIEMKVGDIITRAPVAIGQNTQIHDIVGLLLKHK